jgi:hypothetical protein
MESLFANVPLSLLRTRKLEQRRGKKAYDISLQSFGHFFDFIRKIMTDNLPPIIANTHSPPPKLLGKEFQSSELQIQISIKNESSRLPESSNEQVFQWVDCQKGAEDYRRRAVHRVHQVRPLEWLFINYSQYPSPKLKRKLAIYLNMSYAQTQKWFQTRRQRKTPALLSHRKLDEKEWAKTLEDIQNIIKESTKEEQKKSRSIHTSEMEPPSKKPRVQAIDPNPPISRPTCPRESFPLPAGTAISPTQVQTPPVLPSLPKEIQVPISQLERLGQSKSNVVPNPKTFPSTPVQSHLPTNPPKVDEDQEVTSLPSFQELVETSQFRKQNFPNTSIPTPRFPPLQYPFSHFLSASDERLIILPPPLPRNRLALEGPNCLQLSPFNLK